MMSIKKLQIFYHTVGLELSIEQKSKVGAFVGASCKGDSWVTHHSKKVFFFSFTSEDIFHQVQHTVWPETIRHYLLGFNPIPAKQNSRLQPLQKGGLY